MKRVLIVGGSGFIGSAITDFLKVRGYDVGVYDKVLRNTNGVHYYHGNILEDKELIEIFREYEVLIYLISSIMPQDSMDNPSCSYSTDIPLLLHTLNACKSAGIKRIIYSSSGGSVYGEQIAPSKEDETIPDPINHYAICKLTCEKILLLYNHLYEMENIVLRISNPYGLNQQLSSGVGAVTAIAKKVIRGDVIQIYGDGENIRDYLSVKDVAKAFYLAIGWKYSSEVNPVFNVGSGEGLSLNQVIYLISRAIEKNPCVSYIQPREFDLKYNVLDMNKTEKYLGRITEKHAKEEIRDFCINLKERMERKSK